MRQSERSYRQKNGSNRSPKPLAFERLEERRLLASDLIQSVTDTVLVAEIDAFLRDHLKLGHHEAMRLVDVQQDQVGFTHYEYQQTFKGVPVEGGVYSVHAKEGELVSVSGRHVPISDNFVGPRVGSHLAFDAALNHVDAAAYIWNDPAFAAFEGISLAEVRKGELVYYATGNSAPTLAYKFDLFSLEPFAREYLFVDARTGSDIVGSLNRFAHADTPATGIATYDGLVNITVDKTGPNPYLTREARRNIRTLDVGNTTNTGGATPFSSPDNTFDEPQHDDGVQVHFGVEWFYDYFYFAHGRDSYDGNHAELRSFVNYDVAYDNALWTGTSVRFGDGDGTIRGPWVSLDIVGHEFTHGIVESAVGVPTFWQFNALNESFADIFGTAVERYARRGRNWNWTIGEDIQLSGTDALRSLANPTLYGGGIDNYADLDIGNTAHQNAGVQNKWFYLLANDIGFDEAAAIAYRNLTVYLVSDSSYTDARLGSVQSAIDLYGNGSVEHLATQAAWDAVGVLEYDPQNFVLSDFEPVRPLGSQIYRKVVTGAITDTDPLPLPPPPLPPNLQRSAYQDVYYVELDGRQTISALVERTGGDLEPNVRIISPGGGIIADVAGGSMLPLAATRSVEVPDPGTYTIIVSGTDNGIEGDDTGQFGDYRLEVYLNADIELESYTGDTNDQPADAQQMDVLPNAIGFSDAEFVAVVGNIDSSDTMPGGGGGGGNIYYFEGFESGEFPPNGAWTQYSSNSNGRIQVTNEFGAANGNYALWMDVEQDLQYALNEVVWDLDLSAVPTPHLNFAYAEYADEGGNDRLPVSWEGHEEGDGVSFSVDNTDVWYRLGGPFPLSSEFGVWEYISYDLEAAAMNAGVVLGDSVQIKFQQYDNYSIDTGGVNESDGRGWDDISISDGPLGKTTPVGDWYRFALRPGESVEFVATNIGSYVPTTLDLILYDSTGTNPLPTTQRYVGDGLSNVDVQTSRYTHLGPTVRTFFVNIAAEETLEYSLIATFNSLFDTEATVDLIHEFTDLSGAIGYLTTGDQTNVEPDDYSPGFSLQNVYPDAILLNTSGGGVYASHDVTGSPDFLVAPTGSQVFTPDSSGSGPWDSFRYGWNTQNEAFRADFLVPQFEVSIQFNTDTAQQKFAGLYAYRADGSLIDSVFDSTNSIFMPKTLVVTSSAADIAYVIAGGENGARVMLDDLRYTSDIDSDVYKIDAIVGDVFRFGGFVPAQGSGEFQNNLDDVLLTLYWRDPNNNDALVYMAGGTTNFIEEILTQSGEFELHVSATAGQGEYYLSDILEQSPVLAHLCSDTEFLGNLNGGVATDSEFLPGDSNGYLMYSVENVHTRFPSAIQADNADHLVAVRFDGTNWQLTNMEGVGWLNFTPERGDVLIANVDFDADVVIQDLKGQSFIIGGWRNGIRGGYLDGDLVFQENFYNNAYSEGDYTVSGTYIITQYESTRRVYIPPINSGVLVGLRRVGTGYLMYSQERVQDRFPGLVNPNNSDHIIAVRYSGGQWQFVNVDSGGWVNFTPDENDVLLADVNFGADTVTSLIGTDSTINGIKAGFASGDVRFHHNRFIEFDVTGPNRRRMGDGVFDVRGSYFDVQVELPTQTISFTATTNFGIAADDGATGRGYLMYTRESVHSTDPSNRFAGNVNVNNADHLIAVRLSGGQWQYTNKENEPWRRFVPRTSDVLLAEIDFDADTITSLEGREFRVEGVAAGYRSGTILYFADQWNGGFDNGEFDVGTNNPPFYEFTITEPQHEILGEIIDQDPFNPIEPGARTIASLNFGVAAADGAVGTGYIMYSAEEVDQRFRVINSNNSDHFVAVRYHDRNWEYTNSDTEGWLRFTPQLGDILVAEVDYGLDLVTMLEGTYDVVGGIIAGYIGGNLTISANRWNGFINRGEYYLTGNYISTHCPPDVERLEAIGYRGLARDDSSGKDSSLAQPTAQARIGEPNRFDFVNRTSIAEVDSRIHDYIYYDALTHSEVFGSAILPTGRTVIGRLAEDDANQVLAGRAIVSEHQQRRDLIFESIVTDRLGDLSADWLDELVSI